MTGKTAIKKGEQFKDGSGSLLEVVRRKDTTDDKYWCKGVPDVIGEWLYSGDTIRKGRLQMKKKSIPSLPSFPADGAVDRERIHRMMVTTDFCLRGIEPKQSVLAETPLCTGWMIFLNRGCTLAHIMHADDAAEGTYIRMKIPHTLQGSHPEYLRRWFYHRMKNRYII